MRINQNDRVVLQPITKVVDRKPSNQTEFATLTEMTDRALSMVVFVVILFALTVQQSKPLLYRCKLPLEKGTCDGGIVS
ncbi:hypothetical protein P879_10221 [Paragonimus westermani]|uniref:Uncharacterized protein n=1 Tax=Paragonimus westermani TaxID=34504 RepID=A0A8T0DJ26_9TREM|nr:hypothetical protein P879_10221 [Paragonimus westermani]